MFPQRIVNDRRHFLALAGAMGVLALSAPWRASLTMTQSFGLFGALHAGAVVVSLCGRRPLLRSLAFIALAAVLSMGVVRAGLHEIGLRGSLPGPVARIAILAACSGLGAAAYGALIRVFWWRELTGKALVALAAGCMAMTSAMQFMAGLVPGISPSWLAAAWWCAFSAALCRQARRSHGVTCRRVATAGSVEKLR